MSGSTLRTVHNVRAPTRGPMFLRGGTTVFHTLNLQAIGASRGVRRGGEADTEGSYINQSAWEEES